jgi:hypothetical protein
MKIKNVQINYNRPEKANDAALCRIKEEQPDPK